MRILRLKSDHRLTYTQTLIITNDSFVIKKILLFMFPKLPSVHMSITDGPGFDKLVNKYEESDVVEVSQKPWK